MVVGFEVIHTMKKDHLGNGRKVTFKLDMSKGYNCVEWVFLEQVMLKLGFEAS